MNSAFVFIKPHANTAPTQALVKEKLAASNITIVSEGELTAEQIDAGRLIDQHYYAIASKATLLQPKDMPVPADKFEEKFGLPWAQALENGNVYNAIDACKVLGLNATQLEAEWKKCGANNKLVKFGGGFYCGLIDTVPDKPAIYSFNAFFMSMRGDFVEPGTSIHYYVVEWSPENLSWADFRGKVLGPTDPSKAPAESIRGTILSKWEELQLTAAPDTGKNGVHASASPFEGLAERMNWLGVDIEADAFGRRLLDAGIPKDKLIAWTRDPQIPGVGSCFDSMEDLDADACVAKAVENNSK